MCTVVLLLRPGRAWPMILVANRDEQVDRAWDPPMEHWPDQPGVIAGRDRTAGGTWMGLNRHAVTAAVLNRPGSLGPAVGKRSRGELPLLALAHSTARASADAIVALDAGAWRGFNMVLADRREAIFIRGAGHGRPTAHTLPPGVSMITAHDPNDADSPRVARHLVRFQSAAAPVLNRLDVEWNEWRAILSDRSGPASEQINVEPRGGFGTVCSSLLAIPDQGDPLWLFASAPPDEAPFLAVSSRSPMATAT